MEGAYPRRVAWCLAYPIAGVVFLVLVLVSPITRSWVLTFVLVAAVSALSFPTALLVATWPVWHGCLCIDEVFSDLPSPSGRYTAQITGLHCALKSGDLYVEVRRGWDSHSLLGSSVVLWTRGVSVEASQLRWETNEELSVVVPEVVTTRQTFTSRAKSAWAGLRLRFVDARSGAVDTVVGSEPTLSLRTPFVDAVLWLLFLGVGLYAARVWFGLTVTWQRGSRRSYATHIALPWLVVAAQLALTARLLPGPVGAVILVPALGCAIFGIRVGVRQSPRWALPRPLRHPAAVAQHAES